MTRKYEGEVNVLRDHREKSQLDAYLQTVFISDHKIQLIGPGRLAELNSYGIETAYDLDVQVLYRIRGFGEAIRDNLMNWKQQVEAKFRFDPNQSISPTEMQSLAMKYMQLNQHHETTLRNGMFRLKALREESLKIAGIYKDLLAEALRNLAQAEADITLLGQGWHF